jgi:hypothetical protein
MVSSIYIPYIAPSLYPAFAIDKIKHTFQTLDLGTVSHVLLEALHEGEEEAEDEPVAHKAYVFFSTWNTANVAACNIAARLARREAALVVYADPHTWTLLPLGRSRMLSAEASEHRSSEAAC